MKGGAGIVKGRQPLTGFKGEALFFILIPFWGAAPYSTEGEARGPNRSRQGLFCIRNGIAGRTPGGVSEAKPSAEGARAKDMQDQAARPDPVRGRAKSTGNMQVRSAEARTERSGMRPQSFDVMTVRSSQNVALTHSVRRNVRDCCPAHLMREANPYPSAFSFHDRRERKGRGVGAGDRMRKAATPDGPKRDRNERAALRIQ